MLGAATRLWHCEAMTERASPLKDKMITMSNYKVTVLGAGLAGCEAALWLAGKGVQVELYEQKPTHFSPAHKSEGFAELICSNSLKAERLDSASGLLKEEMRRMGSQLLNAAEAARVAAGGALAVDRDTFSAEVTRMVEDEPNITVHRERVEHIDESTPILVATGPLTDGALADEIGRLTGDERLHFYDAVAPIVTAESLDYEKVFAASRYDRGEADYLNCPFNKAEYEAFHAALASAERAPLHEFDAGAEQGAQPDPDAHGKKADTVTVYEGCMPIEIMAARGADTMRFGPLRPVGLIDPRTGHRPWANVQLRAENKERTLYNIVGFQTNLKWGEQKRVFSMIPGLGNAEFVRYGVMHRNTFLDAPRVLSAGLCLKDHPNVFFAGQITGFEGYMESAACGLLAARNIYARLEGKELPAPPIDTMCGALIQYLTTENKHFSPWARTWASCPRCRRTSVPATSACVTWPWPNGPWPASSSGWMKITSEWAVGLPSQVRSYRAQARKDLSGASRQLPLKGEPLAGRAALSWMPEAQCGAKGRALLQRPAASGQRTLSSCRESRQQGTTVFEISSFAHPVQALPTRQWLPLWGSWRAKRD